MIPSMLFTGFFAFVRCLSSRLFAWRLRGKTLPIARTMHHLRSSGVHNAIFAVFALLCLCGLLFSSDREALAADAPAFKFSVSVKGTKLPDEIKAQITDAVALGKTTDATSPATLGQLRRRANEEALHLNKVLRSQAYFNGRIEAVIEEATGGSFNLIYRVTLGPRTMIRSFNFIYTDHPSDEADLLYDAAPLGLKPNRAARAQRIIDLTGDALVWLENHGHPTPKLVKREVIVDMAAQVADITLTIKAGEPRYFGAMHLKNEDAEHEAGRTKADYIEGLAAFKEGDLFDRRKADETVAALRGTGLFDQVVIEIVDAEGNRVTPSISLSERAKRSVGIGASWSSDEGAGTKSFWEHRNLFGRAEKLRLEISVAQTKQAAKAEFTKPRFLRPDQSLLGSFEFANEETDAYSELSAKLGAGLSRQLTPTLQGTAGVSFEIYRTEENSGARSYRLFGVPLTLRYDGSDNLLDPTKGSRLSGAFTPYVGTSAGSAAAFSKFEASGSTYWSFGAQPDFTLALRGRYGLMLAQETLDVPGSLRFYAGGGGSIRGYGYQLVGPLDAANDPTGGRSVVEASTEARWRVSKSFGVVAFVDGGNAYSTSTPQPSKGLQWGAGLGLRYYTPIGPVRADIAVPLNKRSGVDDSFQVYFSLGQAF